MLVEILLLCFAQFLFFKEFFKGRARFLTNLLPLLPSRPSEVALVLLLHGGVLGLQGDVGVSELVETILLVVNKSSQPGQQLGRRGLAQAWSSGQKDKPALVLRLLLVRSGGKT